MRHKFTISCSQPPRLMSHYKLIASNEKLVQQNRFQTAFLLLVFPVVILDVNFLTNTRITYNFFQTYSIYCGFIFLLYCWYWINQAAVYCSDKIDPVNQLVSDIDFCTSRFRYKITIGPSGNPDVTFRIYSILIEH